MSSRDPSAQTTTQAILQDLRFFFPSGAMGKRVRSAIEFNAATLDQLVYNTSGDMCSVIVCDTHINIRAISASFSRYVGHPQVAMIGHNPKVMQGEMTTEDSRAEFRELIQTRRPGTVSIINYTSKGEPFLHKVALVPLLDSENELTSFIGIQHSKMAIAA